MMTFSVSFLTDIRAKNESKCCVNKNNYSENLHIDIQPSTGYKASENLFDINLLSILSKAKIHIHVRPKMVGYIQMCLVFNFHLRVFCSRLISVEIGTGFTCDSEYFEI